MSGTPLTERRIFSAALAVHEQVETAYETVFKDKPADGQFFEDLEDAYKAYLKRTAKRPLKPMEVKTAQRIFRDQCRSSMAAAKKRAK